MLEDIAKWIGSGAWLPAAGNVVRAIVIVSVALLATHLLHLWLGRLRRHARGSDASRIIYVVQKIGGYIIIVVGSLAALSTLGFDLQSFSVFAGALGVGVGLGLQGIVREFFSGLVLIFNPAVRVGDFVELETGVRGEIVEIGTRSTRLRTNDDINVIIPNSRMIDSRVTNLSYNDAPGRIHVPFSVIEAADKARVREVVLAAAHGLPFTHPDSDGRKTQVWLVGFAREGLDFELIVWPTPESSRHPASMHAAYMWAIHDALTAAGIDNAAPQLDLRVQRVLGLEGEEALRMFKLAGKKPLTEPHHRKELAPNDAAAAVFDDAKRDAKSRVAEEIAAGRAPAKART